MAQMMTSARRAVIFDLYGTLADVRVDEKRPGFWEALALDCFSSQHIPGKELRARYERLCQEAIQERAEGFMLDALFADLLGYYGLDPSARAVAAFAGRVRRHSLVRLEQKPYTDDLLRAIRAAGYQLGLVSNTEALLTDYDLKMLELTDRFGALVLSSRVGVKKPDRRIFALAVERLATTAAQCVFVGDNPVDDISGALDAGMDSVYLAGKDAQPAGGAPGRRVVQAAFDLGEILAALRELGFTIS